MNKLLIILIAFSFAFSQTEPVKDLHSNKPRVWALTHAMIHTEPGDFIKDGTIVIRNGKIEKVGRYIQIPGDAFEIDLEGANVYAGFIDGWLEVKQDEKVNSPDDHWNKRMRTEYRAKDDLNIKEKDLKALYSIGFTAAHIVPENGIFKGKSDLVILNDNFISVAKDVAQVMTFKTGGWGEPYPHSLLGMIAFMRQSLLDAEWYGRSTAIIEKYPEENEPIPLNPSLAALEDFRANRHPMLFKTREEHGILRALNISSEFNLNPWIYGSGFEYRRLDKISEMNPFFILPLEFPAKPKVTDPYIALQYSTEQLKHWDMAPDNFKKLYDAGLEFCLTSSSLKKKTDFRNNLQKIIDRGLPQDVALAALTTFPAKAMGLSKTLGRIQTGYIANLVVIDGDYFDPKSRIISLWLSGEEHYLAPRFQLSAKGFWKLNIHNKDYVLEFSIPKAKKGTSGGKNKSSSGGKLGGTIALDEKTVKLRNIDIYESNISFTLDGKSLGFNGALAFNGKLSPDDISGFAHDGSGQKIPFLAKRTGKKEPKPRVQDIASEAKLFYPEGAYGTTGDMISPNAVLVNDATIWTCGPKGILEDWDILFVDGKIKEIAPDITVTQGSALIIDATGKHVTPGLIDCHSHSAASSINEGAQAVTAEVRIKDVLFADDINVYRQLGGGLTTANILHGSANPIGGQNAVIKLRWGAGPEELLFKKAPQGIKFALGENVKQANWPGSRYPQTRMGVEQVIRDAFRAAQDYRHQHKTYNRNSKAQRKQVPPRIDLELEALAEILEGTRLVHCHSYRQDEILMLTRIAEDFGFTIATFQHVLEGYKVADRIAEHGAGASTFSDWWQYKYEVIDAIPYNGTLMAKNDVLVSFNSDDDELARRMNTEAAKAIKYGGLDEEDALKFVTLNPAKQLKIDKWVGSLEEGKDADFVIWNGPPLDIYSQVQETWIEGIRYFSIDENAQLEERDAKVRQELIQKILSSTSKSAGIEMKPNSASPHRGHNCEIKDKDLIGWEMN
ncbi:MAG: amidohydrolase family protein [Candidatus Marinimicrobia bacterium]|jgi:imidazolonepropionase-like amidohydrolase|nr:amidohydrolase family protein [Candidatus Neomarinimicrobiota bacterium]MBT3501323.1 amidohydrolase family protein [Candidatus Neomarinimicrobiota bacterium]MBT3838523.1 amidohydrolase family protein [Candidatus Neomarinimicrobiota bacterium]MBT3999905.1 amidohydrolase family protein [Candidatus Neomarinimicrobiota bacterium]MBT4282554.1 amidohydrolase family protein [Candidatus Neomarinimicrobiota bacterium]